MNAADDACAACGAAEATRDVEVAGKTLRACSEGCAADLRAGKSRAYSTMAIDTDVLRKALQKRREKP